MEIVIETIVFSKALLLLLLIIPVYIGNVTWCQTKKVNTLR